MSIMDDESMVTFSSMAVKEASLEAMSGDEWRGQALGGKAFGDAGGYGFAMDGVGGCVDEGHA